MATSKGTLQTLSLSSLDLRKGSLLCNDAVNSPTATHLPHSSDDSSATIRLDSHSLKGCTSPTSELEPTLSPPAPHAEAAAAPAASTPTGRVTRGRRSPAPSPATPVTPPQLKLPPAAAAVNGGTNSKAALTAQAAKGAAAQHAQQEASSDVDGTADAVALLPPPNTAEGPAAAAEYEAYKQRWEQGTTLAQRWARLASQGKTASIQTAWEDLQLDLLLQTHCYNTPQAAAARAAAAAAAAAAQASPTFGGLRSPRGARRSRSELELDAALLGEAAAAMAGDDSGGEGAAASPATRRVRARQAPKSFRDFEVDLPTGSKSSSDSPEPAATTPTAATAAVFSPAGGQDMDAYIGAGILLDLFASSAPPAKPQAAAPKPQPKPKPVPKARQAQQQQLAQQSKQSLHQQQQQQQGLMLPAVQVRPKVALVLDLSGSPKHPDNTAAAAAAATAGVVLSPVSAAQAGCSSSPSRFQQQQRQRQVLHLGLPSTPQSMVSPSMSPLSSQHNHSLPPRPPRMPQQHTQQQLFATHHFAYPPQQRQPQQPQQQQQQQEAELKPEHIQAALDVATKLGAALGNDSQAFARIMAFVHSNSNKPAALYQFMSATLAQIQGGSGASPTAGAGAAAAAAGAAGAAATPGKQQQQPRGLML